MLMIHLNTETHNEYKWCDLCNDTLQYCVSNEIRVIYSAKEM